MKSQLKNMLYKLMNFIPDCLYVRLKYRKNFGKLPNLRNPKTFNEKLNWLKLNDHKPLYTTMVDKHEAKQYVARIIGEEYIIPTYGVWDSVEEIDFDALPDKFVLKTTHDSGSVVICKEKKHFDREAAKNTMRRSLHRNFYAETREWPYKNVKRRIIAEAFLEDNSGSDIADFKVHNFNGKPKFILVCRDRFEESGLTEDFYDTGWKRLSVRRPGHPNASVPDPRPESLDLILQLSEKLSKGVDFMRTDFYVVNGKVYFGEITLYPSSASTPFVPESYDKVFGDMLNLHKERRNEVV